MYNRNYMKYLNLKDYLTFSNQDYVHVMCYDYHGKWDKKTGHNAPLYPR